MLTVVTENAAETTCPDCGNLFLPTSCVSAKVYSKAETNHADWWSNEDTITTTTTSYTDVKKIEGGVCIYCLTQRNKKFKKVTSIIAIIGSILMTVGFTLDIIGYNSISENIIYIMYIIGFLSICLFGVASILLKQTRNFNNYTDDIKSNILSATLAGKTGLPYEEKRRYFSLNEWDKIRGQLT
jgi:predicted histidine transporter YuiF (NhaC family)